MLMDFELAVAYCVWIDDKRKVIKLDEINPNLFTIHRKLFDKVYKYRKENKPWDIIISKKEMDVDIVSKLITFAMITDLAGLPLYDYYLDTLKRESYKTQLNKKAQEGMIDIKDLTQGIEILKDKLNKDERLFNLNSDLSSYIDDLEKRKIGDYERYKFGIKRIDDTLGYILPGRLITIGGLSGVGKTNFALRLFSNLLQKDISCLYLSSEMGYFSIIDRIVAMNSHLSAYEITNGIIEGNEIEITKTVSTKIANKKSYIYEISRFNIDMIKEKTNELKIKFIFLDFLQMFRLDIGAETRASAMAEIITQLKELAMDKKVIIIALSQVNKEGELKESRGIEEKSDIVIKMKMNSENFKVKNIDINIYKNRYGKTNVFKFILDKKNCNFFPVDNHTE